MIKRSAIIISLLLIAIGSLATYSFLPDYLTKKMSRHLSKVFGKQVVYEEMEISDTLCIDHQLFRVSSDDTLSGYSLISKALGCKLGGCDKPRTDTIAFEEFYFMTAFDKSRKIKKVRVLEYTSEHGYQIANKGWLRQFEKDTFFTVGENIDGISGATISVKSITKGVNDQTKLLESVLH